MTALRTDTDIIDLLSMKNNPAYREIFIRAEADRLYPFLEAIARRHSGDVEYETLRLNEIFNLQAERTSAMVESDFSILSDKDYGSLMSRGDIGIFFQPMPMHGRSFGMGFAQNTEFISDDNYHGQLSCTIPIILMDDHILQVLKPDSRDRLLHATKSAFTLTNHDYLHHFSMDIADSYIARIRKSGGNEMRFHFIRNFGVSNKDPRSYEAFLLMYHARSFNEAAKTQQGVHMKYFKHIESIFAELKNLQTKLPEAEIGTVTKYFGDLALLSMTRVMSVNCDVFEHYLRKAISLDPKSGDSVESRKSKIIAMNPIIPQLMEDLFVRKKKPDYVSRLPQLESQMIQSAADDINTHFKRDRV